MLGSRSKLIGQFAGMIQPKQCAAIAPDSLSTTLLARYESPTSISNGPTPDPSGSSPPVVTYTGTLQIPKGVWVKIKSTGVRGVATFRTYLDGLGVTPVEASDQPTAATYLIPTTAVTVNFPLGTYTNNNVYKGGGNPLVDLTANAYNFTNGTTSTRPLIITAGPSSLASLPVWRFDGVDDRQIGPSALATAAMGGTDNSFMATLLCYVNAVPAGAATACLFAACHTTDANVPLCEFRMSSTAFVLIRRATAANSKAVSSLILPSTGPHLFIWGFDGASSYLRDNGVYIIGGDSGVSGAQTLAAATTFNQISLGARSINSGVDEFSSIDVAALCFHNGPVAGGELEMYESYFL